MWQHHCHWLYMISDLLGTTFLRPPASSNFIIISTGHVKNFATASKAVNTGFTSLPVPMPLACNRALPYIVLMAYELK